MKMIAVVTTMILTMRTNDEENLKDRNMSLNLIWFMQL